MRLRYKYAVVAVGLILLLIFVWFALYTFIAPTKDPTQRKDFVQAYAVIVGGLAAFLTLLVGWRNLRHNQKTLMQSQKSTEKTLENARVIEVERAQNDTLQKYVEQMGQLLTKEELRSSEKGSNVRALARSQTLAVLAAQRPGLEGGLGARKRFLLQFLYESRLIDSDNDIVILAGADLRWVWFPEADLGGANLGGVDLRGANLGGANLGGANLSRADLSWGFDKATNLRGADLTGADLRGADLGAADLSGATLTGANLTSANLREANLSHADLRGLDLGNGTSFEKAILKEADLKPIRTTFSIDVENPTKGMDKGEWERSIAGTQIAETIGFDEISQGKVYMIADLSFANLKGADLEGADLRFVRLHEETILQGANLARSDLRGATNSERVIQRETYDPRELGSLVPNEWLERQAHSIEGATMPDGSTHD